MNCYSHPEALARAKAAAKAQLRNEWLLKAEQQRLNKTHLSSERPSPTPSLGVIRYSSMK